MPVVIVRHWMTSGDKERWLPIFPTRTSLPPAVQPVSLVDAADVTLECFRIFRARAIDAVADWVQFGSWPRNELRQVLLPDAARGCTALSKDSILVLSVDSLT